MKDTILKLCDTYEALLELEFQINEMKKTQRRYPQKELGYAITSYKHERNDLHGQLDSLKSNLDDLYLF